MHYWWYISHRILFKMVTLLIKYDFMSWKTRWRHCTLFLKDFPLVSNILANTIETFDPIARPIKGSMVSDSMWFEPLLDRYLDQHFWIKQTIWIKSILEIDWSKFNATFSTLLSAAQKAISSFDVCLSITLKPSVNTKKCYCSWICWNKMSGTYKILRFVKY